MFTLMSGTKNFVTYWLLTALFTYGVLYTSYKFGRPDLGNHDFGKYSKMVDSPLNMHVTKAPFVLRQLPCLVASGLKKTGIYYPNKISFEDARYYTGEDSQRTLFALILSNYLAVVTAITLIIAYIQKQVPDDKSAYFTVIALCLGYFMFGLNIVAPLTQGYGWLATTIIAIGLLERKYIWLLTGTIIALFSRETVLVFFAMFTIIVYLQHRQLSMLRSFILFVTALCALLLLRLFLQLAMQGNFRRSTCYHTPYQPSQRTIICSRLYLPRVC
jgi:hypothetical protein